MTLRKLCALCDYLCNLYVYLCDLCVYLCDLCGYLCELCGYSANFAVNPRLLFPREIPDFFIQALAHRRKW